MCSLYIAYEAFGIKKWIDIQSRWHEILFFGILVEISNENYFILSNIFELKLYKQCYCIGTALYLETPNLDSDSSREISGRLGVEIAFPTGHWKYWTNYQIIVWCQAPRFQYKMKTPRVLGSECVNLFIRHKSYKTRPRVVIQIVYII